MSQHTCRLVHTIVQDQSLAHIFFLEWSSPRPFLFTSSPLFPHTCNARLCSNTLFIFLTCFVYVCYRIDVFLAESIMAPQMRGFVAKSAARNMVISGILGTIGAVWYTATIYSPEKAKMAAFREYNKAKYNL